ncbi:MAG: acyltransferase family protein [Rhodospirillaceae bacterium]
MPAPPVLSLAFRPDLQGLRAIAILLVVFAHTGWPLVAGGFIGVDVFFVLSGYLITGLLWCEVEQNGRLAFMRFYVRRLKRLLPALVAMLGITAGSAIWLLSGVEAHTQLASAPFAATWTSNLYFSFRTLNYFDELAGRDIFLHTWSLGVEEQFYLVWPVVLLGLFRFANTRRTLLTGLGIAFIVSLLLSMYLTTHLPQAAFYLMPSRIWQFALGAIIYIAFPGDPAIKKNNISIWFALTAGLLMICGSAVVLNEHLAYPGVWALVPSVGAALVIAAGNLLSAGRGSPLAQPGLVWLGDRSYSLYLWHWPIFVLGFSLGVQGQVLPTLGLILLSLLAAMLSYRFIERPFWKGRMSHAEPLRILLVSLLVMAIMLFGLFHGLRHLPQADTTADISNQWRSDVPIIYRQPCDAWYFNAQVEPCVFGTETAKRTVVFLGDSVGAQWFSMIPAIFPVSEWRIIALTKSSCPIVDEDYFYPRIGQIFHICAEWRNAVLDEITKLKPEVLIMGSASTYDFSETQWIAGSARIFERLSKSATAIIVIPGTPNLNFDGPGCVARYLSPEGRIDSSACLARDRMQHVDLVKNYLKQAAGRFPNVRVLDLNDLVCPGGNCNAVSEDGLVIFRDSQHLTDAFVQARISLIRERLVSQLAPRTPTQ